MEEKEYQEKMTIKYGNAEELYKKRKEKSLIKKDIYITENNVIKVKENVPVHWRQEIPAEKKEVEIEGEIYSRIVKNRYVQDVYEFVMQDTKRYWKLKNHTFKFELLDLEYKFCEFLGLYFNNYSENEFVNAIVNLFRLSVFDKKIKNVYSCKSDKRKWKYDQDKYGNLFEEYTKTSKTFNNLFTIYEKNENLNDIDITIYFYRYGFNNEIRYKIGLDTVFQIKSKIISKYLGYENIENFKYLGLDLEKTSYNQRISWFINKYKKYKEAKINLKHFEQNKIKINEKNKFNFKTYKQESQCYIIKDENTGLYKIGKSIDPLHREKTLQSEKPLLKAVKIFQEDHEAELHDLYKKQRVRGEWFNLTKLQLEYVCRKYN